MTEYQIEQLEKIFPDGFVIVAAQSNGVAHCFVSKEENENDAVLSKCYNLVRQFLSEENVDDDEPELRCDELDEPDFE